jgi:hypothetical protein
MASAPVGALPAYRVDGADSPGIAGTVAYDAEGCIEVIVDWKSDVDIGACRKRWRWTQSALEPTDFQALLTI